MPPRKQPDRRQGRGTRDVGQVLPLHRVEVPKLPGPKLKLTRVAWAAFWADPMLAPLVREADMPALVSLFDLYDERERAWRAYRKERAVTGSTGQLAVNPFAKAALSMQTQIDKLEERFGITPASRLKLGIAMGAAAKSLEDINRAFEDDEDDEGDESDPRVSSIEAEARDA